MGFFVFIPQPAFSYYYGPSGGVQIIWPSVPTSPTACTGYPNYNFGIAHCGPCPSDKPYGPALPTTIRPVWGAPYTIWYGCRACYGNTTFVPRNKLKGADRQTSINRKSTGLCKSPSPSPSPPQSCSSTSQTAQTTPGVSSSTIVFKEVTDSRYNTPTTGVQCLGTRLGGSSPDMRFISQTCQGQGHSGECYRKTGMLSGACLMAPPTCS